MWLLYQILMVIALVLVAPWMLVRRGWRALEVARRRLWPERAPVRPESLWVHAVSVGEVGVAATVIDGLPESIPLTITTVTPTGQDLARDRFGDRAQVTYLPFELAFALERFLDRFDPIGLILAEGDLWPLALRLVKRRRVPVVVVNGRIGDRSFRRMMRFRPFVGAILGPVDHFAVQSERDGRRLQLLGIDRSAITVTGNLKFETEEPAPLPELEASVRAAAAGRPILVAGSTMPGEEEQVLNAFRQCGDGETALLVLAPRHPERWDAVARLTTRQGFPLARRSALPPGPELAAGDTDPTPAPGPRPPAPGRAGEPSVLLLDSLGELASLYRIATGAFIGGTLVATGGHNPLEPMRFGVPVAAGPSMFNFRAMEETFDRESCWRRVADAGELAATWREWLDAPNEAAVLGARGRSLVEASRGALERTLAALAPILAAFQPSSES